MGRIITLEEYAMGRDVHYPEEWALVKDNAIAFLEILNAFLQEAFLNKNHVVASGWRPQSINDKTPNASKKSYHIRCLAVDLKDHDGWYKSNMRPDLKPEIRSIMEKYRFWMEDPASTPRWCHLDIGERDEASLPDRIFRIK